MVIRKRKLLMVALLGLFCFAEETSAMVRGGGSWGEEDNPNPGNPNPPAQPQQPNPAPRTLAEAFRSVRFRNATDAPIEIRGFLISIRGSHADGGPDFLSFPFKDNGHQNLQTTLHPQDAFSLLYEQIPAYLLDEGLNVERITLEIMTPGIDSAGQPLEVLTSPVLLPSPESTCFLSATGAPHFDASNRQNTHPYRLTFQ